MSNITEQFVKGLAKEALELLATSNANDTTRLYWDGKLNAVTLKNWAINPVGFVLKGLSPYARRPKADTVSQFLCGLDMQLTSTLEQQARKPDSPLAKRLIEKGNFYSAARTDSQYGSKESRELGHKVAHEIDTVKGRKAGATLVQSVEVAKKDNMNAVAFNLSQDVAMLLKASSERRKAKVTPVPAVVKPVVTKPVQTAPEIVKPAKRKGKGKAA